MKKNYLFTLSLLLTVATAFAQQNVGIGTNTPETKLQVNGAISLAPADDAAAASVTIPDNVSIFRLRLTAGGTATVLSVSTPKEGQLLTIYNQDDNAATFSGNTIIATTGVCSFTYINGAWRMTSSNSVSGPQGPAGPQGPVGPAGSAGAAGAVGPQGPVGPAGSAGAAGSVGPQGPVGPAGSAGAAGSVGPQGPVGPAGSAGAAGAVGPQGPVGPAGSAGAAGAVGPQGPVGPAGSAGAAGAVGPQGPVGPVGSAGAAGAQGPAGPQGAAGLLPNGSAAGNTPYWNGSAWVVNNSNVHNNGGNVGVGTTAPVSKMEVVNTIAHTYPTPGLTYGTLNIAPASSSTADQSASITFGAAQGVANAQAGIYVQSSGSYGTKMYFGTTNAYVTGSQSRMMIDHAGNVGIGNIAPSAQLHTTGTVRFANYPNGMVSTDASGNLQVRTLAVAGTGIAVTNGNGVAGNPTLNLNYGNSSTGGALPQGNFGQFENHGTYTDFNTTPAYWGWNYVQGNANGPNATSDQWYRQIVSLGGNYAARGAGGYSLELAYPRSNAGAAGMWMRVVENGSYGSWYRMDAGNAATGSGTTNYLARWTSATTLGTGATFDNGSSVGIGTASPGATLDVNGSVIMGLGNVTHKVVHGNNARMILPAANNGATSGDANLVWWISEPGVTWTGAGIARNMYNTTGFPRINSGLTGQMIRFNEGTGIIFTTETSAGARNNPLVLDGNSVTANSLSGSGNVPVYADNNGTLYKGAAGGGSGTTIRSVRQTANIITNSATFSDMGVLTLTFTPTKSTVYVFFSAGVEISSFGMGIGTFRVLKDGVVVTGTKCLLQDYDQDYFGNVYMVVGGSAAINGFPVTVTPGVSTTIKMQWKFGGFVSGDNMWCYPTTYPDAHHGVLTIME